MIRLGDVFWRQGHGEPVPHRYIVASDPKVDSRSLVLLPIVSWEDWKKDDSCIIKPNEYEPLKHLSCIEYRHAIVIPASVLLEGLNADRIARCPRASDDLIRRMHEGAKDTRFLSNQCLYILSSQEFIP